MRWHGGYATCAAVLLIVEIGIALFVDDNVIRPHGGDVLAVMLLYCAVRAVTRLPAGVAAMTAFTGAIAIESAQLLDMPEQLGWQANPVLRTIFGHAFDPVDIAAYAIGLSAILLLEAMRAVRAGRMVGGTITPDTLWSLTLWLPAGFVAVNLVYWPAVLASGTLPADADSVAIPMLQAIPTAAVLGIVACGTTWWALRRRPATARWTEWRRDRPWRSWFWSSTLGGAALWLTAQAVFDITSGPPTYELLWSGYGLTLAAWLLGFRAILMVRQARSGSDNPRDDRSS